MNLVTKGGEKIEMEVPHLIFPFDGVLVDYGKTSYLSFSVACFLIVLLEEPIIFPKKLVGLEQTFLILPP